MHDVVNVLTVECDEKGKDECDDIVMSVPYIDIDGSENTKEREMPSYSVNEQALVSGDELVDDGSGEW